VGGLSRRVGTLESVGGVGWDDIRWRICREGVGRRGKCWGVTK
jgi:hypothetical protein